MHSNNAESAPPEWKQLEILVAEIQKELAPGAKVSHNVKLPGRLSETERQIDVLIEQNIGQYPIRIVIDCKDYAVPVDVKGIEEFHGLVQDVGAHKAALVCPSGFSKSAKKRAKKLYIDLYSPVDTDPHKWQVKVSAPVLCDFRAVSISFGISFSDPLPFKISQEIYNIPVFNSDRTPLGTSLDIVQNRWSEGKYPFEPGEHPRIPIIPEGKVLIDNGYGTLVNVEMTIGLRVHQNLYLGHLPIERIRGLKDEQTGLVVANAFTLGNLDPAEVEQQWERINPEADYPFQPVLTVMGLVCWGVH